MPAGAHVDAGGEQRILQPRAQPGEFGEAITVEAHDDHLAPTEAVRADVQRDLGRHDDRRSEAGETAVRARLPEAADRRLLARPGHVDDRRLVELMAALEGTAAVLDETLDPQLGQGHLDDAAIVAVHPLLRLFATRRFNAYPSLAPSA